MPIAARHATSVVDRSPLPRTLKVKFRYFEQGLSINPGSGTLATYDFYANSCYDPNNTGTGHQPMGFDELMAMYRHGTVIAASATVHLTNGDTSNEVIAGIAVSETNTSILSLSSMIEYGNCQYATLSKGNLDGDNAVLRVNVNPNKFLGIKNPLDATDHRFSDSANISGDGVFFRVFAAAADGSTDVNVTVFSIDITYVCILMEPAQLTGS